MIATALLYLFNLLIILLAAVIIMRSRNKEHFFAAIALPYNNPAVAMNDLPFITQNEFLVWKNSLVFRNDINVSKNTYEPKYLENLLKPFAKNTQITAAADYSELTSNVKISLLDFQKITDRVMNVIVNAINYDLFRNPNRPLEIICPNLNSCSISLIQKKIISIQRNKKNGKLKWFVLLEVILSKKGYSYGITCVVEDNQLVDISVIGIRSEDDVKLLSSRANQPFWGQNTDKQDPIVLPRNKINTLVNAYLKRQLMQSEVNLNKIQELPNEYKCYGSYGQNQLICENAYDSYYHKKKRGVWDKICTVDSECPFFKANKNYTNKFGGCVDGFCEMPLGIKSVSPFFYDIHSTPLCYNCPNKGLNCCKDQTNPDYIFKGDLIVRKAYENDLINRGLSLT